MQSDSEIQLLPESRIVLKYAHMPHTHFSSQLKGRASSSSVTMNGIGEFDLPNFVAAVLNNQRPANAPTLNGEALRAIRRLAARTGFLNHHILPPANSFSSQISLIDLIRGSAASLDRLEAVILSFRIVHQIMVSKQPVPHSYIMRILRQCWADIVRWCCFLVSRVSPSLGSSAARTLLLLMSTLVLKVITLDPTFLYIPSTSLLSVQLWVAEDDRGNGIYPELGDTGDCHVINIMSLCCSGSTSWTHISDYLHDERVRMDVVQRLLERAHLLYLKLERSGTRMHPIIEIKITSIYVETALKLLTLKEVEETICNSRFLVDMLSSICGTNYRALSKLQADAFDCPSVPPHAFCLARRVLCAIMQGKGRYRLANLKKAILSGILGVFLSAFVPGYPPSNDDQDIRGTAIDMITLIFIHSPYTSVGMEIEDDLRKRLFNGLCVAIKSHSAEGEHFVRSYTELRYSSLVPQGVLYKNRNICAHIECPEAMGADAQVPVLKRCSRCRSITYCSSRCQRKDWKAFHRAECGRLGRWAARNGERDGPCIPNISEKLTPNPGLEERFNSVSTNHVLQLAIYLEALCAVEYGYLAPSSAFPEGIFDVGLIDLPLAVTMAEVNDFIETYVFSSKQFHHKFRERVEAYIRDASINSDSVKLAHMVCSYGDGYVAVLARLRYTVFASGRVSYELITAIGSTRPANPEDAKCM
ncbi:hypothetical protein NMY22_g4040 [Coprinellus aureogranulatus]|nr:hypothetical protein NMY22_g4040 [Coprinellus aureogranulatus]